ncbi:MAG: hypothetical protein U9R25_13895 [Chloroflexota bacterium]|nr:hypothetical protein [Chloroflexota bacterium]
MTQTDTKGILGTNLSAGEFIRLFLILCAPPWLLFLALTMLQILPVPGGLFEWLTAVVIGPLAWGALLNGLMDGRTILGRPVPPGSPRQSLMMVVGPDIPANQCQVEIEEPATAPETTIADDASPASDAGVASSDSEPAGSP